MTTVVNNCANKLTCYGSYNVVEVDPGETRFVWLKIGTLMYQKIETSVFLSEPNRYPINNAPHFVIIKHGYDKRQLTFYDRHFTIGEFERLTKLRETRPVEWF